MNRWRSILLAFTFTVCLPTPSKASRNSAGTNEPLCSPQAICFSGEVAAGEEFRKPLNDELEFALKPGWTIEVRPRKPEGDCTEFAAVVTRPYRYHRALDIDTSYGIKAEDEVSLSPREFSFVTNCRDYRTEFDRLQMVLWPYTATEQEVENASAKLGSSPLGRGRLWITDSRISHSSDTPGNQLGEIEWMRITVEILLPQP